MDTDTRIYIFSLCSVLFFGAVLGSFVTFNAMDDRIDSLERNASGIGDRPASHNLTEIFERVQGSVVYIEVLGGERAQGSGFIYDSKGHIVTNNHVIRGAEDIRVTLSNGSTRNAEIVGTDDYTDLAVLKIEGDGYKGIDIGDSRRALIGDTVVAVGNPFGFQGSMTRGIISQKGRLLPAGGGFSIPNVIQTDASINPGNSGGPLLNTRGQVIGVNTAIESQTGTFQGVGFAIPSETVERVIPSLIENGDYRHPWIGISGLDMNQDIAEAMDVSTSSGFLVSQVSEGGPADRAGIRGGEREVEVNGNPVIVGGDIVVGIEGKEVRAIDDLLVYLARDAGVGDTVTLEILRDGETVEKEVKLGARRERQAN